MRRFFKREKHSNNTAAPPSAFPASLSASSTVPTSPSTKRSGFFSRSSSRSQDVTTMTPVPAVPVAPRVASSSTSSGSSSIRTPDDDHADPPAPSPKSWRSWIGGRKNSNASSISTGSHKGKKKMEHSGRQDTGGQVRDRDLLGVNWQPKADSKHPSQPVASKPARNSTESEDESDSDSSQSSSHRPIFSPRSSAPPQISSSPAPQRAYTNLRALTLTALNPPPPLPPLVQYPGRALFPRSSNAPDRVKTPQTLASDMHRQHLLKRIEARTLSRTEDAEIKPFADRNRSPPTLKPKPKKPVADDEAVSDVGRGGWSRGLNKWVTRVCFEERMVDWYVGESGVEWRKVKGHPWLAVAELEFSDGVRALSGLDQALIPPSPAQKPTAQAKAPAMKREDPVLAKQTLPPLLIPLPATATSSPSTSTPSTGPETPVASVPRPLPLSKRGVRFAPGVDKEDREDDIPLGVALNMKREREERLRRARQERAERERQLLQERAEREQRLRQEQEERERRARAEERKKQQYMTEVIASRERSALHRGGGLASQNTLREMEREREKERSRQSRRGSQAGSVAGSYAGSDSGSTAPKTRRMVTEPSGPPSTYLNQQGRHHSFSTSAISLNSPSHPVHVEPRPFSMLSEQALREFGGDGPLLPPSFPGLPRSRSGSQGGGSRPSSYFGSSSEDLRPSPRSSRPTSFSSTDERNANVPRRTRRESTFSEGARSSSRDSQGKRNSYTLPRSHSARPGLNTFNIPPPVPPLPAAVSQPTTPTSPMSRNFIPTSLSSDRVHMSRTNRHSRRPSGDPSLDRRMTTQPPVQQQMAYGYAVVPMVVPAQYAVSPPTAWGSGSWSNGRSGVQGKPRTVVQ